MMRWLRGLLMLLALGSLGTGAGVLLTPTVRPKVVLAETERVPFASPGISAGVAESLSGAVLERAPFRAERVPAPLRASAPTVGVPAPVRPVLVLRAIAWGANPAAVVEGFPDFEAGRVVIVGDTVAGLRVAAVRRSAVVIVARDTMWMLRLEVPK